ncbi:MAG: TRAP transporter small permease subunit [Calditrichaeota bacterium]|nr:TRAP transporter small permease subunit [Calditrichota bacterium]
MKSIEKLKHYLLRIESWLILAFLGGMIGLGILQILIRKLFNESIPYADQIMNMLVLYIALVGAALATLRTKHITFEIVSKLASKKLLNYLDIIVNCFCIFIIFILYESVFEYIEFQKESLEMFFPDIQTLTLEKFLVPGMAMIGLGFVFNLLESLMAIFTKQADEVA